jgi:hypothetical protein
MKINKGEMLKMSWCTLGKVVNGISEGRIVKVACSATEHMLQTAFGCPGSLYRCLRYPWIQEEKQYARASIKSKLLEQGNIHDPNANTHGLNAACSEWNRRFQARNSSMGAVHAIL